MPAPVQDKILALCASLLAANGIAFVSYNTLPGWRMLSTVREAMLYHTRDVEDPRARVAKARATLDFLAEAVPDRDSAYGRLLRLAAEHIRQKPDYYVLHEYLEETNEAVYFEQFVERVVARGLRYLGDSDVRTMLPIGLPPKVDATLHRIAPGLMRREQFLDFLKSRSFRQSLLIRAGAALDRKLAGASDGAACRGAGAAPRGAGRPRLGSRRDLSLCRRTKRRGVDPHRQVGAGDIGRAMAAGDPLRPIAPSGGCADRRRCARRADRARHAGGRDPAPAPAVAWRSCIAQPRRSCSPQDRGPRRAPSPGATRRAARLARTCDTSRSSLRDDERALLPLLDGTRTRDQIAASRWPALPEAERLAALDAALASLGRQALLVR